MATAPCEPCGMMPCDGKAKWMDASSTSKATSTEPWPCPRIARAEARIGTSRTPPLAEPPRCSSITAAATARGPLRPCWKRTIRRHVENCEVSLMIDSSASTSPRMRSASTPPISAPPSE
eukprot:scaffold41704_cov31-Tisochrysis_lutea.AAC.1